MSILKSVNKFAKLASDFVYKKAFIDPKLKQDLFSYVAELPIPGLTPADIPAGTSLDLEAIRTLHQKLISSINAGNLTEVQNSLNALLGETRNGGGSLYPATQKMLDSVLKAVKSDQLAKHQVQTPSWLETYKPNFLDKEMDKRMVSEKTDSDKWLENYINEEAAKSQADENISGMQASIQNGPSVRL